MYVFLELNILLNFWIIIVSWKKRAWLGAWIGWEGAGRLVGKRFDYHTLPIDQPSPRFVHCAVRQC